MSLLLLSLCMPTHRWPSGHGQNWVSDPHPGVSGSTQFLNRQRGAGSGPGSERSQLSAFGLLFALAGCAVDADVALPVDALSPDEPGASSERPTSEPPDIDATPGRELPSCAEDALLCGATCVDPNLDADHCGSCGARCGADQLCGDGICNRHDWSRRIAGKGWQRVAAVATAAVREARNGTDFVTRVQALGIPLRVISPEIEAALSYRSAAHHFPGGGRTLVADIGGGSLELVGATDGSVNLSRSLPLGAVRLTERLLPLAELQDQIRRDLEAALPGGAEWSGSTVIGSGGTFTTLASMTLAARGAATGSVHGITVTTSEVEHLMLRLAAMPAEQRRQVSGLPPERADIIVAGLAVALQLLETVEVEQVTVSGFGLRDGLLLEMVGVV